LRAKNTVLQHSLTFNKRLIESGMTAYYIKSKSGYLCHIFIIKVILNQCATKIMNTRLIESWFLLWKIRVNALKFKKFEDDLVACPKICNHSGK